MGTLHYLCSVVALLTLVAVRLSVSSPDDQCQFVFKEDSVLDVERSQNDGAIVTTDLHVEDKVKCAEACCNSEGEWCTLAVFHTKTGPEQMNCFLVQCVPDGSQNNVCVTKHVRHSGFITADVKHPTPPTSPPPPSTTPPPPPPPDLSPDTPPKSLHASSSSTVAPKFLTSASSATPTSLTISANDSVEALNNLNAALNSSLTSPSQPSNPAPASITPKPSSLAATDIPSHEKPTTVKATAKATTKATTTATPKATTKATTQAVVADTTPTPKWSSPASVAANKTSDSNATQPINATQSGQDQTKSREEVNSSNINRTTVTQTGILIVTLCFGIIFLLAMMVVVGKRWCEGYQRRKYSKVDYLINGYYS